LKRKKRSWKNAATADGFSVDRKQVILNAPIKYLGVHTVTIVLHPEVSAIIQLNVARSTEEAELQASGISVADQAAEDEAAAELEIAELFEDIGAAELDDLESGEAASSSREASEEAATDGARDASDADEKT